MLNIKHDSTENNLLAEYTPDEIADVHGGNWFGRLGGGIVDCVTRVSAGSPRGISSGAVLAATVLMLTLSGTTHAEPPCSTLMDATVQGVCGPSAACGTACVDSAGNKTNCSAVHACVTACMEICNPASSANQMCTDVLNSTSTCKDSGSPYDNPTDNSMPPMPPDNNNSGLSWNSFEWANQTSTAFGGNAVKAIDGNLDGDFNHGSVTHTALQNDPAWWGEVEGGRWFGDIHMGKVLDKIVIVNRSDCCADRLAGAEVWVHQNFKQPDGNFGQWLKVATLSGAKRVYEVTHLNNLGVIHQVMVLLPGKNKYLSLAEVYLLAWD
jgi:hypothetical protein